MEEAALLAAIAAHPEEDTPRLAYADWLDEHAGDSPDPASVRVRAEFIRVQCELKKLEGRSRPEQQRYIDLYRRQDAILTHHRHDLLGPLGDVLGYHDVIFDRGFVSELNLDAETFLKHADAVATFRPLPDVRVSDGGGYLSQLLEHSQQVAMTVTTLEMQSDREPTELTPSDVNWLAEAGPWLRLRELDLGHCRITDWSVPLLMVGEPFPALTRLDLTANEISDDGVRLLVASPLWPRLRHLVLDRNPIGDEGAFALADAPPTAIRFLNVRGTAIGNAGRQRLLRRKGWNVALF